MTSSNQRKAEVLGMPYGTANAQLRKSLLFYFVKLLGFDICFQCNTDITNIDDFSIEHKQSWFNSLDPYKAFFDLDNIAFSHLSCNVKAAFRPKLYKTAKEARQAYWKRYYAREDKRKAHLERKRKRYAEEHHRKLAP